MTVHKIQPNRTLLRAGFSVFFLAFVFLCFSNSAFATSCVTLIDLDLQYKDSDVVFLGIAAKIDRNKGFGFGNFNIEKAWKGISETKVDIHGSSVCDDKIERNERYLIFAYKSKKDGRFHQRYARKVKDKDVVLRVLDFMVKGVEKKKIFGEIFDIAQNHKKLSQGLQAVELIWSVYGLNMGMGYHPPNAAKILKELKKNPDPQLSADAGFVLDRINYLKRPNPEPCVGYSPFWKEYYHNDVVFLGRTVSVKNKRGWNADKNLVSFEVEKAWKGVERKKVEMISRHWGQFKKGERYLVYAENGYNGLESLVCNGTKIARNIEIEMIFLDKLAKGMQEKEIFKWLLSTAQTYPQKKMRKQALALMDSVFDVSTPDIPEGVEEALKIMAGDPNYEHRQYAQTILDKIKLSKENKKFLPAEY